MDFYKPKSKSNRKNRKIKIDLANVVYDEEFVSLINSLSTIIKNYYSLSVKIIKDLYNNSLIIDNNIIYSKCFINEINYNTKEKIKQLEERIDGINNTKKIIEKNILLIDSNLKKFFYDSKLIFQNLKTIRNSKINFAIESGKNIEHLNLNNSMINFKTPFEKNDLMIKSMDKERYIKKFNNSNSSEKSLPSIMCKRNRIIPMKGNSTEINKRHRLKLNYFNKSIPNYELNDKDNLKMRNRIFDKKNNNKKNYESTFTYRPENKKIQIGNINNILEFTPELAKTKSSFNNFYINQHSNINLNSNNINNNNNLELSYKVIEFLSLLSSISKNNKKENSNMNQIIHKFEKIKKNLFELSKKFIEQNSASDSKIYSRISSNSSTNGNIMSNISKKDRQLIMMNNNIENINKEIIYKELTDKINYLSDKINKLEKQNKKLYLINNNTKKELINNTLLLSKKNNQLNLINNEKSQFISQINVLQKDNEALMELIQEKNKGNIDKNVIQATNDSNIKNLNIIKQKENTIKELNKQLIEIKAKYENIIAERNDQINNLNKKLIELNDSLKYFENLKKTIQDKENIIQMLQKNNIDNKTNQELANKNSYNHINLIKIKSEEFEIYPSNIPKRNELNIEQVSSFVFLRKINDKEVNNNNDEDMKNMIEQLENKVKELNLVIESKGNEIKKYKNENSILKGFAKYKKKNEDDEDEKDSNNNDKEYKGNEEEINRLKNENQKLIKEKENLKLDYEQLLATNKNNETKLQLKASEIRSLENNKKELEEQIKDLQIKNIQNIYDEKDSIKEEKEESGPKNIKSRNILEQDTEKDNDINQLKEDIKEKDNEIEYLKIEIQELKSKIEDYEENINNSSFKNSELNDKYNTALEEKVKFLTERNEYYQKLYNEDKIKLQNLENININLKNENIELKQNKKEDNNSSFELKEKMLKTEEENEEKKDKKYSIKEYDILDEKSYDNLKWYLLANKNMNNDILENENEVYNYNNLIWAPKINIVDIEEYDEKKENEKKKDDKEISNKIYKNEIHINRNKEISFSNNFSFHNNSEEINKNRQNNNNNSNSQKRGSLFSLGNNYINMDDSNNDYNKLLEKYKLTLDKLNKTEEKYEKLQKKYSELKDKIKKNSNINILKVSISEDSNNFSNCHDVGKLSLLDNNFEGEGDIIKKLNKKNEKEQDYYESIEYELEATKNQLKMVKDIYKETEKKFETVKKIIETLFNSLTLKKKEKEECKILLKILDFSEESISLIIDKKKK